MEVTEPSSIGNHRVSLADFTYLDVDKVLIGLDGTSVTFDYLRIVDHAGASIDCGSTAFWSSSTAEVVSEFDSVVIQSASTAWSVDFTLPEGMDVRDFPTLQIAYTLDSDASTLPEIRLWALSGGDPTDPSPSEVYDEDWSAVFMPDGSVHSVFLDLEERFNTYKFYKFQIRGLADPTVYNLTIHDIQVLSRDDDWIRVSGDWTDAVSASGLIRLDGWADAAGSIGTEQEVSVPASIAHHILVEYLTTASDDLVLEVYAIVNGSKYSRDLPAFHSSRKAMVDLSALMTLDGDENVTAIGVELKWTLNTGEYVWAEITELRLMSAPLRPGIIESFSGVGLDFYQSLMTVSGSGGLVPFDSYKENLGSVTDPDYGKDFGLPFMVLAEGDNGDPGYDLYDDVDGHFVWTGLVDYFYNATGSGLDNEYMMVTESNMGTPASNDEDSVDLDNTDLDGSSDVGTQGALSGAQTYDDSQYMNLLEENIGGGGGTEVKMEWGYWSSVSSSWTLRTFQQTYTDPIVIATGMYDYASTTGEYSVEAEVQSVTSSGCQVRFRVPEHDAQSGWTEPSSITVHYIIVENTGTSGSYVLPGTSIKIQAGKITDTDVDSSTSWTTDSNIPLHISPSSEPMVFGQRVTHGQSQHATTWSCETGDRDDYPKTTATDVHIHFQRGEVSGADFSSAETLHYVIVESGTGTISGASGSYFQTVRSTDSIRGLQDSTSGYATSLTGFSGTPTVCIAHMASMDGGNGAWAFLDSLSSSEIRSWALEDQDKDTERAHTTTKQHFWVFESAGYFSGGGDNYSIDFEYQWTDVDTGQVNAELCFFVQSHTGTEGLEVYYWNSGWTYLDTIVSTGWTNITLSGLSSTYTIRLLGSSESSDTEEDSWDIDLMAIHTWSPADDNYQLEVKYEWADANYTAQHKTLSIYVHSHTGNDALKVYEWVGSWSWIGDITGTGWTDFNGVTVTGLNYTIKFVGDTESSDGTQDIWNIDLMRLHAWTDPTPNYEFNVEFSWTDADYTADFAELCIWVEATGSEHLNVEFWNVSSGAWEYLDEIDQAQWNRFTALGLDSSAYKIRLVGTQETGDTVQNSWNIDLIALNTSSAVVVQSPWDSNNIISGTVTFDWFGKEKDGSYMVLNEGNYGTPEHHTEGAVNGSYVWTGLIDQFDYAKLLDGSYMTVYEENTGVVGSNSENDVDNNTSNVDSSDPSNLGTEMYFGNATGIGLDSQYMTLTEEEQGGGATGFKVYQGSFEFSSGTSTDINIGATIDPDHAFLRMYTAGSGSPKEPDEGAASGYILSSTQVRFERHVSNAGLWISWFIIECFDNEFTIRGRSAIELNGVTSNTASVSGVVDQSQVTVTYSHRGAGTSSGNWDDTFCKVHLTDSTTVTATRATSGSVATIRYEVVEWRPDFTIHTGSFVKTSSTQTVLISGSGNPDDATIDMSRSWMMASWTAPTVGIQQVQLAYRITNTNELEFRHYSGNYACNVQWYVIEHPLSLAPNIYRYSYNWDPSSSPANVNTNTIGTAVDTSRTFIHMSCSTSGTGTAFRRDFNLPRLVSSTSWSETQYYSTTATYDQHETRAAVIELPYSEGGGASTFVVDREYQWTTADTGQTYANVSIYIGDHTGSTEGLKVQYYSGSWQDLGTISGSLTHGWANFTASGLIQTYTIRLVGASEASDTDQDTWEIDLITLHTWTADSTNYELDVKFEWANADFSADHANVSIYVFSHNGTESLRVDEWVGLWSALGIISNTGWNNFTTTNVIASNYTIRFVSLDGTSDTYCDDWKIDLITLHTWDEAIPNYMVNVEFQWDNVDTEVDDAKLCIWLPSVEIELLNVEYWNESATSWQLLGSLNKAAQWNNFTVTDYMDTPFKMRLVGTDEISDGAPNSWNIDAILLRTSSLTGSGTTSETYWKADFTEWTTDSMNMTVVATKDEVYGCIDAESNGAALTAAWNVTSLAIDDQWLVLRWRYNGTTAQSGDYEIILQHDGLNTTLSLLTTSGAGLSDWIVVCTRLADLVPEIQTLEMVYLRAKAGEMHIEYIAIDEPGLSTTGLVLPDTTQGTVSIEGYGFSVTDSSQASFAYDKVDMVITPQTVLSMRVKLDASSVCYLELEGLFANATVSTLSHQLADIVDGWNDISLNLSALLESYGKQMDTIANVRLVASDGGSPFIGLDTLWIGIASEADIEEGAGYFEVLGGSDSSGVTIYGLDLFGITTSNLMTNLTTASWYESTGLVNLFVGKVNYSESGPVTDIVDYLEDGVPIALMFWPRPNLRIHTTGHDLNLHVVTDAMEFALGENETSVVLDFVNVTDWTPQRIEFTIFGWLDDVSINRTYSVTSAGMINWTTYYGDGGTQIESISVWQELAEVEPLVYLNRIETVSDIVISSGAKSQEDSLTEGHHSVEMGITVNGSWESATIAAGLQLADDGYRYMHLSIKPYEISDAEALYKVRFMLNDSSYAYALSWDNDTEFEIGEDFVEYVTSELFISLAYGLDVDLDGRTVQEIAVLVKDNTSSTYSVGMWLDDLYLTDCFTTAQDDLMWTVLKASDSNFYDYYDASTTYTDTEGVGLVRFDSRSGLVAYGSAVKLGNGGISTGPLVDLTNPSTVHGSLFAGPTFNTTQMLLGKPVSGVSDLDMAEQGSLKYIAEVTGLDDANITIYYYFGNGTLSPYSVIVSGKTGYSATGDVVYLNLTEGSGHAVSLDVNSLFIGLNVTEGEIPDVFRFTTTSGIGTVFSVSPEPMLPLCAYETVDRMSSLRMRDINDNGVDQDGYITSWISSPRDAMDRSLYVGDGSQINRLTRNFGVSSPNVTISYYQAFDFYLNKTLPSLPAPCDNATFYSQWYGQREYIRGGWSTILELLDDGQLPDPRGLIINTQREYSWVWNWLWEPNDEFWYIHATSPTSKESDSYQFEVVKYWYNPSEPGLRYDQTTITSWGHSIDPDFHDEWWDWTIDLCHEQIEYVRVEPDGTETGIKYTQGFNEYHQMNGLTEMSFVEDLPGTSGNISYFVDDLRIMTLNGTKRVVHEDFSYGDFAEMTTLGTGWSIDNGQEYLLTTSRNMGFSRSVLDIDPEVLSSYYRPAAQLEFNNGWYTATKYNEAGFFSGYDEEMMQFLGRKFCQHYFTVLDVAKTDYYKVSVIKAGVKHGEIMYIDGREVELSDGDAFVYLRTGLHSIYLRVYHDNSAYINAFRVCVQTAEGGTVEGLKAYVPHHGRMTAVYYDSDHMGRLRELDSPSYYTDPSAMLDKANIVMVTDSIGGMKVVLDADDLLRYMLRDINTGAYDTSGHAVTPLYESAGSVIFTSDAIPDTIYMGEYEGSIVERYLEMSGYVVLDGNVPFYMTTHADGTSSIWPRGPIHVLDMEIDDAWYHADGAVKTYSPKDIPYKGLFSQTGPYDELWARSHTYEFPISDDGTYGWKKNVTFRSDAKFGFAGVDVQAWTGYAIGGGNEWQNVSSSSDALYKTLFAPGRTTLSIDIYMVDSVNLMDANFGPLTIDGYYVRDMSERVSDIHGGPLTIIQPRKFQAPRDYSAGEYFTITIDLSGHDVLYDVIVDTLHFSIDLSGCQGEIARYKVKKVTIKKDFMVRTHDGIDPNLAMALPTPDCGVLKDMRLTRQVLPSWQAQAEAHAVRGRWHDVVKADVMNYALQRQTLVTLKNGDALFDLSASEMTSETAILTEVDFKYGDDVNPYSFRLAFEQTTDSHSSMAAMRFYWQVWGYGHNTQDDRVCVQPTAIDSHLHRHWMADLSVVLKRDSAGSVATDTGKLLFGDISDYSPLWSLDTNYLEANDRKFITYGTWGNQAPTRYANPVTFQADEYGGGIVTFGISQMISEDHVWYNISISDVYMDYIARANHMNLWGHTPLKDVVTSVQLDYTMEDRLELWNQEGWVDELYGSTLRGDFGLGTLALFLIQGQGAVNTIALGMSGVGDNLADTMGGERYGDGNLDSFIERMDVDYDGADWYSADQYPAVDDVTGKAVKPLSQTIDLTNTTLLIRPSLSETSDWDTQENPRFDLIMPGIHWATAPGSIARHQVVRGSSIHLDLDWTDLDPSVETIYINARLELEGRKFWINRTIPRTTTFLDFDLKELDNSDGTPIWFSNMSKVTVPSVTLWAYKEDPTELTDIASMVSNLLFADIFHLRMEYDKDYIQEYYSHLRDQGFDTNTMKKWMILLGVAMIVTAPITGGSSAMWGMDMIVSTTTGKSMFDHIIHGAMRLANTLGEPFGMTAFEENYIGNFSMMNMVSQKGLNLIMGELLADAMSLGIGGIGKAVSARMAGRAVGKEVGQWLTRKFASDTVKNLAKSLAGSQYRALKWLGRKMSQETTRFALEAVGFAVKAYIGVVGEVVFEFAFDNMMRFDKSERPMGGSETFMATMVLAVLTSAALSAVAGSAQSGAITRGIAEGAVDGQKVSRVILGLQFVALGLQVAMLVQRIPVMMAVAR